MAQHNSLFAVAEDRKEAYEALRRDFKRDHRTISICDIVTLVAVFYLCRDLEVLEFFAVIALVACGLTRLNSFIDNSNRNWFMHFIDWENERERERVEAERGY